MEESLSVKIQYFHDALMTQIDNIDSVLISNYKISAYEMGKLYARKSTLKEILERYESLFASIIYVEK